MEKQSQPGDVDHYIAAFSPEVQAILRKIRATIREVVPEAGEKISYQMPTFTLDGSLIHYAAFKKHIGMYPPLQGDDQLRQELANNLNEKGNLKFPLDQPIPYDLIRRVAEARLQAHRIFLASKKSKA